MQLIMVLRSLIAIVYLFSSHINLIASAEQANAPCRIQTPYRAHKLISLIPTTTAHIDAIHTFLSVICEVRILVPDSIRPNEAALLILNPAQFQALQSNAIYFPPFVVLSMDVEQSVKTFPKQSSGYNRKHKDAITGRNGKAVVKLDREFYTQYHVFEDLLQKWGDIARTYPQHVKYQVIGKSVEGRPIVCLRIGKTDNKSPQRILLNGLQHAREWISTYAPTFIAESLAVAASSGEGEMWEFLNKTEVLVVAMVNPDGYVFSHVGDRFARKNRRRMGCSVNELDGVDLNRNWGKDYGGLGSTSLDICSQTFIGTEAFSEPESRAVRDLIESTPGILAHIDFHSFGQFVLGAWGYTDKRPERWKESEAVGKAIEKEMSGARNNSYKFGAGSELLYPASGVMSDWTFAQGLLSFTVELRPKNIFGMQGFVLEEKQILGTCEEGLAAIVTLLRYVNDSKSVFTGSSSLADGGADKNGSTNGKSDKSVNIPIVIGIAAGCVAMGAAVVSMVIVRQR